MKTFKNLKEYSFSDDDYNYQKELTKKLDEIAGKKFNQDIVNEIILWKVSRYALMDKKTMSLLNSIDPDSRKIDRELTRAILRGLLDVKGIRLPIASTILRFKNPKVYQIIDQRAYRYVYGVELALQPPNKKNIESQIDLYFEYLAELKNVSKKSGWSFSMLDRILYNKDIELNADLKVKY